eukprot:4627632-Prorocentrum_lima.AAC.1
MGRCIRWRAHLWATGHHHDRRAHGWDQSASAWAWHGGAGLPATMVHELRSSIAQPGSSHR